jgi:hypothetical protein
VNNHGFSNMRNDVTIPFFPLRNRKNDVIVTFRPTLQRKERCSSFISAKSVKKRTKNSFFFYKYKKKEKNLTIPIKKNSVLTTTLMAVLEKEFSKIFSRFFFI